MNDEEERQTTEPVDADAASLSVAPEMPILIAVGASGAATEPIEEFLGSFQTHPDSATVLVLQHREALDDHALRETVEARNGLQLTQIENGTPVEGGQLYLPPANVIVTVKEGRFLVRDAQQQPGMRGTIDSFLLSLAEIGDRSIGVILQGTAGDGTLGMTALKEQGGLTIAERGGQVSADEITARNAPGATADFLIPATDIPALIETHLAQLRRTGARKKNERVAEDISQFLDRVANILRNKLGHDFHGYKPGTFMRRVERRMQVRQIDDIEAYLEVLRQDGEEVQNLFNDLLIGVTQFFRDAREFGLLENEVIPKLFEGKEAGDQLRVWVLGCATGEEAYSIAILLREYAATVEQVPQMQIFATDIDVRALAAARVGRFSKSIAGDLTPERLARWFVQEGDTYCIAKELREMCIFSSHNVIKDAPFSRLDLISCRNLLIYLNADLQGRVVPLFHFALKPRGFLFLGNSENITRHANLFEPVERRSRIFRRLETGRRALPDFPIAAAPVRHLHHAPAAPRLKTQDLSLARQAERIVERFAPAYVITDGNGDIVHFSAGMGRYLGPASGAASLDLLNLVHRDLRADLREALRKAREQDEPVEIRGARIQVDGSDAIVEVNIEPMRTQPEEQRHFVVIFTDGVTQPHAEAEAAADPDGWRDRRIENLEAELRLTRERLQVSIEDLENTNEELKSSNEEYQSLNEELQSANEELETSKEELQSVNEELTTVNSELGHRVHDLTHVTSDLKNFLESTQIPTIFLDNDLKVMNFTPAATELFHLVETDIGRSIAHIKASISVDELYDDIRKVMRTLTSIEHPIDDRETGMSYIIRILPYRSVDNFISGVVVTFTDVTKLTRAERAMRESEAKFRAIFDNAAEYAIITIGDDRKITGWNAGARNLLGWDSGEVIGREPDFIFTDEDRDAGASGAEIEGALQNGSNEDERWYQRKDGSRFWAAGTLRRVEAGEILGLLKILRDRTEARELQERQQLLLSELQHRVRNTLTIVRSIARMTAKSSASVDEYAENFVGRLDAFARMQTALTRDPAAGVDLDKLIAEEIGAYHQESGERVTIEGPSIKLQPKAAEAFALAVHELATNAVKHGGLSVPNGRISVKWKIADGEDGPRFIFTWIENGVKLKKKDASRRRGFGTELLEQSLSYQLDSTAEMEYGENGFRCTIELPINERTVASVAS